MRQRYLIPCLRSLQSINISQQQEEKKMAGTGVIGILITFVRGPILIAVLAAILIVRYKR